jgi:hypothetical protein
MLSDAMESTPQGRPRRVTCVPEQLGACVSAGGSSIGELNMFSRSKDRSKRQSSKFRPLRQRSSRTRANACYTVFAAGCCLSGVLYIAGSLQFVTNLKAALTSQRQDAIDLQLGSSTNMVGNRPDDDIALRIRQDIENADGQNHGDELDDADANAAAAVDEVEDADKPLQAGSETVDHQKGTTLAQMDCSAIKKGEGADSIKNIAYWHDIPADRKRPDKLSEISALGPEPKYTSFDLDLGGWNNIRY